jgi:hypothetical protein
MATATALRPTQLVAAKVELDIRAGRMVGALYTKVADFLILIF